MRSNRRLLSPPAGGSSLRAVVLYVLGALLVSFLLAAVVQIGATKVVEGETPDHAKSVNDARVSLIQLLAGVSLLGGFVYTARTFKLTRASQRADRFTKAIGQIGDKDSESIRVGGVHTLRLLATEDKLYWPVVEQILCALVREKATNEQKTTSEVQAAMMTLGERPEKPKGGHRILDLRHAKLPKSHLVGSNLTGVWLDHAYLVEANLSDARLENAHLSDAKLQGATLSNANFTNADLRGAFLFKAECYKAVMISADLEGTHKEGALNWATVKI